MNKTATIIILGIVLVIGGVFLFSNSDSAIPANTALENTPKEIPATPTPDAIPKASGYTLADVGGHNSQSSCWSVVNGNVYDLTSWIASHPGGERGILSICGRDGSDVFNSQHGGAQKQAEILATFKIGTLIK